MARVLCDVRGAFDRFGGGAFGGDALPVPGAFGFELVGIAGEVGALVGALIGVVLEALVIGGTGDEAVKAWRVSAEGLGFGPPAVGGVHLGEHLDTDSEAFGGRHEEEELTPFRIAVIAGHGNYDALLVDPATLTKIGAVIIAPLQGG